MQKNFVCEGEKRKKNALSVWQQTEKQKNYKKYRFYEDFFEKYVANTIEILKRIGYNIVSDLGQSGVRWCKVFKRSRTDTFRWRIFEKTAPMKYRLQIKKSCDSDM